MRPALYIIATLLLFQYGCTTYEEEIVPGNVAPPDLTVSNPIYEDYVNRSYILATGREPTAIEFDTSLYILHTGSLSAASRMSFANMVFANYDYKIHSYEETRYELLRDNDSIEFAMMLSVYDTALTNPLYMSIWPEIQYQRDRMQLASDAKNLYYAGNIDMKEVHRRMVNNYLYDQVNMGSQNFVLAVFQQLVNREPTQSELSSGVAMVDGNNSILFLQAGSSKNDFLNILLNSSNYYEGQVIQLYEKYLLRTPNTYEMVNGTQNYYLNNDYIKLQKELIVTDEFIGIN
jgi:hypothetical protein